ncbi:MAG TPA: BON domain-containing protein [Candidatus Binatia bacterium]|nr:BON domain-containing protein [Candidatus Binatia bacterium]
MKNFIWLIPLLLGLNMTLAGCDEGSRQPANQPTTSPSTAPSAATMSDSDLEKAVRSKLESDPHLAKLDVDANADKNEVTLSGTLQSQDMRAKAIELARSAHSGLNVNDKIDVKPAA